MGRRQNIQMILDQLQACLKSGKFSRSDNEFVIACPFCKDKTGHCYVNSKKKVSFCFVCKVSTHFRDALIGHPVRSLLAVYENRQGTLSEQSNQRVDPANPFIPIVARGIDPLDPEQSRGQHTNRIYDYCLSRDMTILQILNYRVSVKPFDSRA